MAEVKVVGVTGSEGFIGKNLMVALRARNDIEVIPLDARKSVAAFRAALARAEVVVHLAGVNRPPNESDFEGNVSSLAQVVTCLQELGRAPIVILASSTQAELDNAYGQSKRRAEDLLMDFSRASGSPIRIFRLPGVFGKWCRPNYNSVVATFCHNAARKLPISVHDASKTIQLVYVDDVVQALVAAFTPRVADDERTSRVEPVYSIALGDLADLLTDLAGHRRTLMIPDLSEEFLRKLYATYTSYLPSGGLAYELTQFQDQRGSLAELLKSPHFGQIFVSRTKPGITRGNHFHHSKVEKFCVLEGAGMIRFRHVLNDEITEYRVDGAEFKVVDIPPGYAHQIQNVGSGDMIVLFWASEIFDPAHPDTYALPVLDA